MRTAIATIYPKPGPLDSPSFSSHRCISQGTLHKLRKTAIATVVLLSLGVVWTRFVFTPQLSYNRFSSSDSSQQSATLTEPSRGPLSSRLLASATGSSSRSSNSSRRPLLVLHWTEHANLSWFTINNNTFSSCPDGNCVGTADRSLLLKADAVLIHGLRLKMTDLPKKRLPHQRYVFVIRESPQSTSRLPLKALDDFFNLTMTYSRSADVMFPYAMIVDGKQGGNAPPFRRNRG